jgi:competence protein ComEA
VNLTVIGLAIAMIVAAIAGAYALYRAIDERAAPPIVIEDASAIFPVVVDVRGAVTAPGLYELPPGARMQDVIAAAGGFTPDADLSTLNLARRVTDGEVIAVARLPNPTGSPEDPEFVDEAAETGPGDQPRLNLNTATAEELETLPGIGEVTAAGIIEFREANGPFRSVDDLVLVEGISARTIERFRDQVTTAP